MRKFYSLFWVNLDMEYKRFEDRILVRVMKSEEVMEKIKELVEKEKIEGASLVGIGAIERFELAYFDVEKKEYVTKRFDESFEVTGMIGNIGFKKDDPPSHKAMARQGEVVVHVHASLAGRDYQMVGGHLVSGYVSGTVEIVVSVLGKVERILDEESGLWLLEL